MRPRILVTGASGLIGTMAVKALIANGYEVVGLSRSGDLPNVQEVITGNFLDTEHHGDILRQARATHLLHLAWFAGPDRWNSQQNEVWADATLHFIRVFATTGGTRAVCAGSCAEYDWSISELDEQSPLAPRSVYGKSKARTGAELIRMSKDLNLSLAWARIFFCYGPHEPKGRLLGDLLDGLLNGKPVECTDGLQERDFLHTADVAAALLAVLESELTGAVNIGSGTATAVRDIIETAARLLHQPDLPRFGAIERAADDPPRLVAVTDVLKSTGFRPAFTLEAGLKDCIEWRKEAQ